MAEHKGIVNLGIFQFAPAPNAPMTNWERARTAAQELKDRGADIILLPELWATGPITPNTSLPLKEIDQIKHDAQVLAESLGLLIAGTLPVMGYEPSKEGQVQCLYNETHIFGLDHPCPSYRKINLFTPMAEDKVFWVGQTPVVVWVRINGLELGLGLMTCFDLRFPELARQLAYEGADILLVSALWPVERRRHFETLLAARAMENQCFSAAANAWGEIKGSVFGGGSGVYGPSGDLIAAANDSETVILIRLNIEEIARIRQKFFTAHPPRHWAAFSQNKIMKLEALKKVIGHRRVAGQKMVFTNGCFDIIHAGHVQYLEAARRMGDFLAVGINSDRSIYEIKGDGRPVNPEWIRARTLAGLQAVDYITIFDEPDPLKIIKTITPDVLVKGADWDEDRIIGADTVKRAGGKVKRIPFECDISTTKIIKKILESSKK
jgi:rfaE bifunctional protein nucleotidyltransferase chain/domain